MSLHVPPAIIVPQGSNMEQAARDLLAASSHLGDFIMSLPECGERDMAVEHFNAAMLWAHQVLARAMGSSRVVVPS